MFLFPTILILFIQGYAFTAEPFLTLLVNNVMLATTREQLRRSNRSVVYYYGDGDGVDMSCTCLKSECDVQVDYDYATALDDAFQSNYSRNGAGFKLKLNVAHNNSQMTCKCRDCHNDLSVIFILRKNFDNILDLKINGLIVRKVEPKPKTHLHIFLREEAYLENRNIRIECDTSKEDFVLVTINATHISLFRNETYTDLKTALKPSDLAFGFYNADNKIVMQLKLHFYLLHFAIIDHPQLIVDVPKNSMEFYNFDGQHIIYYEYEDGYSLNLNCSKSPSFRAESHSIVTFTKSDNQGSESKQISPSSIFTEMKLSADDDKKILQCFLGKSTKNFSSIQEIWGQARILLHRKSYDKIKNNIENTPIENSTIENTPIENTPIENTPKNDMNIIFYSVGGIAAVIVIGVCIFCCRNIRQRNENSKNPDTTTAIEDTAKPLTERPLTARESRASESIYHTYEVIDYAASAAKSNRVSHRYGNINQLKKPSNNSDNIEAEYCVPYVNTINTNHIQDEYCDTRYINTDTR